MTTKSNTADGGSNSVTVTTANSGGASGDAWNLVTIGTGCGLTYATTGAAHGTLCYAYACASGAKVQTQWTGLAGKTFALRIDVSFDAVPASSFSLFDVVDNSSATIASILLSSTGKLALKDSVTTIATNSAAVVAGTGYRIEIQGTIGTTTSNGSLNMDVYVGDSTTSVFNANSSSIGGANLGTGTLNLVLLGKNTASSTYASVIRVDDVKVTDTSAAPLGPATTTSTVTANAGPAQTLDPFDGWQPGDGAAVRAQLDATGSSGTGTLTYTWSGPTGVTFTDAHDPQAQAIVPQTMSLATTTLTLTLTNGTSTQTATVAITVRAAEAGHASGGVWHPSRRVPLNA